MSSQKSNNTSSRATIIGLVGIFLLFLASLVIRELVPILIIVVIAAVIIFVFAASSRPGIETKSFTGSAGLGGGGGRPRTSSKPGPKGRNQPPRQPKQQATPSDLQTWLIIGLGGAILMWLWLSS